MNNVGITGMHYWKYTMQNRTQCRYKLIANRNVLKFPAGKSALIV